MIYSLDFNLVKSDNFVNCVVVKFNAQFTVFQRNETGFDIAFTTLIVVVFDGLSFAGVKVNHAVETIPTRRTAHSVYQTVLHVFGCTRYLHLPSVVSVP